MNSITKRRIRIGITSLVILLGILLVKFIITNYSHFISQLLFLSVPFFLSLACVLVLIPIIMRVAIKIKAMDYPCARKIHKEPIPLLGGVGIFLGFILTTLFYQPLPEEIRSIMIGGSIILVLGTIDDITPLSSKVRLFGQLAASLIVMSSGLIVSFMPETWWGYGVGSIITIIWILGIANALNFADGADGLAAGITLVASAFFFLITLHLNQLNVSLVAVILAGCSAGFLFFNFKPARIYLGDGGSTFLGFVLACIALYGGWSSKGILIALGIPVLILGVLIFDMCYITISRIKNGHVKSFKDWLDYTGKDHFHHRLMHLGFKEQHAVIFIYIICVTLGLSALALENVRTSFPVIVLCFQAFLIFVNITILMLVGRNLTIPKQDIADLFQEDEKLHQKVEDIISWEHLKKVLEEENILQKITAVEKD